MTALDNILGRAPSEPDKPDDAKPSEYNPDGSRRRIGLDHRPRIELKRPSAQRQMRQIKREASCASQIEKLPAKGYEILMILTGDWHGWDIVNAVIEMAGCNVKHLRVATLGFNKNQARDLADNIDTGRISKLTMIVSELFTESNGPEYNELAGLMQERGQTIASTRNHCKLILWELADDRFFVAHGSLNLRRCNAYEQLSLSQDETLHSFFAEYIDGIADQKAP